MCWASFLFSHLLESHYFLASHLVTLVLQELFIFSPRGQLRYLRLQVRVRVGPSLGRVAQIGIFDKSQLQVSHFTLTTLIMHHMEHIQLLHLESKVRDILKMLRIFQIHGIFKIPGIFKQDIQRFLVYSDSSIFRFLQKKILSQFPLVYPFSYVNYPFIHLDRRRRPL